jgi:hypothetical protein
VKNTIYVQYSNIFLDSIKKMRKSRRNGELICIVYSNTPTLACRQAGSSLNLELSGLKHLLRIIYQPILLFKEVICAI